MKKILAVFFAILCASMLVVPSFALDSGYEIPYSDDYDWKRFDGQGVTINVYNWGEYISIDEGNEGDFDTNAEFEKLTGIKVEYTNFATCEEMYAKIKNGGSDYDIIIPSDYMISRLLTEGYLQKLDFDNIPNIKYIKEDLLNPEYDPTNEYSVPYMWGILGIIYNTTLIDEEDIEEGNVESWDIMWDANYAGNMYMFTNSKDSMGVALKKLGYSYNTTNEDEINEAAQLLKDQKNLVQAYVMDEIFDKMENGEGALGVYYAGDALTMMDVNPDLAFAVPKEGTNLYVDAMCIPTSSKNKEAAEMYINYMCETLVALKNVEYIQYSTPHTEAFEYLDEETQNSISYPSEEILAKAEAYTAWPAETTKLVDSLWTDIMSSGNTDPYTVPIFIGICILLIVAINVFKAYKKKIVYFKDEVDIEKKQ